MEDLKTVNKVVGVKQSLKALESGSVKIMYLAADADEKLVNPLKQLAQKNSIQIIYADSMKHLGKTCGIQVGAAVVCILK